MKNTLTFLFASLATCAVCAAAGPPAGSMTRGITVGVILPQSGPHAFWGNEARRGLELAVDYENRRRTVQIKLVFADSLSTPEGTLTALEQVLKQGIVAVVGPISTADVRVAAKRLEDTPLLLLCSAATGNDLVREYPSLYRICFNNSYQAAAMALFAAEELEATRVAVLYDETDPYSAEIARDFADAFTATDGSVVVSLGSVRPDRTDYQKELKDIVDQNVQVVALPLMAPQAVSILKQSHDMQTNLIFIGSDGLDNEELINAAGDAASGHYLATHFAADENYPPTRAFLDRYAKRYPKTPKPTTDAALGFDLGLALADAASRAAIIEKPDDIAAALRTIENLPGVTGFITISQDRQVDKGVVIVRTTPKGLSFVKRYPPAGMYLDIDDILAP